MQLGIRLVATFVCFLFFGPAVQGQLSSNARISVITCGPGTDLYATFGHSAFRVQDPANGFDVVYNYGTFNFNTPNFYMKFARGKLLYSLSRQRFEDFLYAYQLENRWVKEQLLQLSEHQKNELFRFLETNYEPRNRDYKYDFLFNNCSTKIPGVLTNVLEDQLQFREDHLENPYTFRELIHQYLDTNSWSSLGIDLALGAVIDRKAGVLEHMFLPDYVFRQLEHSFLGKKPLVTRERSILESNGNQHGGYFTSSPAFWLLLALMFTVAISYIDFKNGSRSRALDSLLFFATGAVGLFMVFLWFFTDHTATAWNFNLLWACPFNLALAVYLVRKHGEPRQMPSFLLVLMGMLLLAPLFWLLGIQAFSPLVAIVWLALALRYAFLYQYYKSPTTPRS